jgi:hypothetical protein
VYDVALGACSLLADQFVCLQVAQPDRGGDHTQHLAHLFQNGGEHLVQVKGGAECPAGAVEQFQIAGVLLQRLLRPLPLGDVLNAYEYPLILRNTEQSC